MENQKSKSSAKVSPTLKHASLEDVKEYCDIVDPVKSRTPSGNIISNSVQEVRGLFSPKKIIIKRKREDGSDVTTVIKKLNCSQSTKTVKARSLKHNRCIECV